MRVLSTITLPSLVYYNWNKNNPDYWKLPEYKRNMFWYVHQKEDGDWIRVPKPFLPGAVFGTLAEKFAQHIDETGGSRELDELTASLASGAGDPLMSGAKAILDASPLEMMGGGELLDILPGGEQYEPRSLMSAAPDLAQFLAQSAANYDVFRDRAPTPDYMNTGQRGYKASARTSPALKELGRKFPSAINPMYLEWAAGELGGGVGRTAVDVLDVATGQPGSVEKKTLPRILGLTDRPSGGFTSAQAVNFYQERKRLSHFSDTLRAIKRDDPKSAIQYEMDHQKELMAYEEAMSASRDLQGLAEIRAEYLSSESLSDEEKKEAIKEVDSNIEQIVLNALKVMGDME
jgi:hypothetical protein